MTGAGPALLHPHRRLWAIAGPAILANSSAPLVGLVDTWVIGHLPGAMYLAAVGVGAILFSTLFWAFGFLRMSTTGLVAQAHGRGDSDQAARMLVRALLIGLVVGLMLVLFQSPITQAAVGFLQPPADVLPLFHDYFDIRIWSGPAALLSFGINGYLIGTAQAKKALGLQLVLNIANAALNLTFVLGFGLGVKGIALGSLIAEWLTVAVGLMLLSRELGGRRLLKAAGDAATYAPDRLKKLFSTNIYIFARTLLLIAAFLMITRMAATLGQAELAASHVMLTFLMLISLGLDGFAFAAEALAGAAYGRGARAEFRAWVKIGLGWSGLAALLYSAGFALFGTLLIDGLTDIDSVRRAARATLWVIMILPVCAVWCYQFDGIYIGATAGPAMLGTMFVSSLGFFASVDWLTAHYGLTGLWLAVLVFMSLRGITQAIWYPRLERALKA